MSYSNYEQKVILDGYALSGVVDVNGSYGISEKPIRVAGVGFIDAMIDAPLEGNFSMTRVMVSEDPLLEVNSIGKFKFDEEEISGVILYDNDTKGFGFEKARINRYSISCSVGSLPEIQTEFTVYGKLGKDVLADFSITQNTGHEHYPFTGDYVYYTNVNGSLLDEGAANLKSSWDSNSLNISKDKYDSLNETSSTFEYGNTLGLGKDAFEVDSSYSSAANKTHPPIQFTDQASIKIEVSDFVVDAISDFSYSRTLNLNPVYAIPRGYASDWNSAGPPSFPNLEPVQVDTQYPIETDINFTMIANEYEIREIKDRIKGAPKSTVKIEIRDAQTDEIINALTGNNVRLIGESIASSTEGEMAISLTYKGYETLHNPVS